MKLKEIYLDSAASTKTYEEVSERVSHYFLNEYANPSSLHSKGFSSFKIIDECSKNLLRLLNLKNRKVIFTSGASESANLAIKGTVEKYDKSKISIIASNIEHPCVSNVYKYYKNLNVCVKFIEVDEFGVVNIEKLINNIENNTKLVSIIYVNNEIGVVQDIEAIIEKIKNKNKDTLVHIDATQGVGKIDLFLEKADLISISAHKFHGPKGVGALICKNNITLVPLIHGGGQQNNLRSGTINAPLIAGMNEAIKKNVENFSENKEIYKELFFYTIEKLKSNIENVIINTPYENAKTSYHILNISFKSIKAEVLLHMLEDQGIYISTTSACSSKKGNSSVLKALGLEARVIMGSIRISFSEFNTKEEIDYFIEALKTSVNRLSMISKKK